MTVDGVYIILIFSILNCFHDATPKLSTTSNPKQQSIMSLTESWRWFGPNDPVTLDQIRQTGARGIVTALHEIPVGDTWQYIDILKRKKLIEKSGLEWMVVESVPVAEAIKLGLPDRDRLITNYIESIKNLSKCGINVIAYHFMPLLDWTRTDLKYPYKDGSYALAFDYINFALFELFLLNHPTATQRYTKQEQIEARKRFKSMSPQQIDLLRNTIIAGLPGNVNEVFDLNTFRQRLGLYLKLNEDQLRQNLKYFLSKIIPVCDEYNVRLALHPDDPPLKILDIPRIVSTKSDVEKILNMEASNNNGLTLCVGSYASRGDNDVHDIAQTFSNRVQFVHLRNVKRIGKYTFIESNHLDGNINMYKIIKIMLKEQYKRKNDPLRRDTNICMRPDHGHFMLGDLNNKLKVNPGYPLYGRLKGLCELRGIHFAVKNALGFVENDDDKYRLQSKL